MYIERLALTNYRNYETLDLSFSPEINVLIGENAQGKTNIMEAIYVLSMAKSHRTSNDRELIRWEQEYGKIEGNIKRKYGNLSLELVISKKGKKARVNHLEQNRLSHYIGQLNVVMFAPEDLNLVKGSPSVRRRFLDMEIGQISPVYLHDLLTFQKVLKQRNAILRDNRGKSNFNNVMFDIYTEQYIQVAIQIIRKRFYFMELLQKWAEPIHKGISRGMESLKVSYGTLKDLNSGQTTEEMENVFEKRLTEMRSREVERGLTLLGPHRDDLHFHVNGYDIQTFGSQGQQRTTALSLKLAEIELVKQEVGESPILLLDDVLSELDDFRQSHLLNTIQGEVQTFVTTTNIAGIDHETIRQAEIFEVTAGTVKRKSAE
ncbi:DNA replication/repair protein RecF [Sporosarcina pasteurii]|uniref:DNA replication and repair protein RecF n=1 Tax=Sporosarcina pasteurii TaxID=1474 RepID=A0A380BA57_SPOPA|nr:DNA replication/repair protein RecF [Sporosarcina pasteurii]MDS9471826.1 DNA replication/repair protein RecF [Sporosarcina pasteurii]QBQ06565.1 DNA replication/repair protein RecF [Sporosarcina pasteurii]SUI98014.1 DNA replication and repair protein recF [Sporosarcina pasteurii]